MRWWCVLKSLIEEFFSISVYKTTLCYDRFSYYTNFTFLNTWMDSLLKKQHRKINYKLLYHQALQMSIACTHLLKNNNNNNNIYIAVIQMSFPTFITILQLCWAQAIPWCNLKLKCASFMFKCLMYLIQKLC